MSLLVDTSVWSLALRRDRAPDLAEVEALSKALVSGEQVVTTGLILQELLQGFAGPEFSSTPRITTSCARPSIARCMCGGAACSEQSANNSAFGRPLEFEPVHCSAL